MFHRLLFLLFLKLLLISRPRKLICFVIELLKRNISN